MMKPEYLKRDENGVTRATKELMAHIKRFDDGHWELGEGDTKWKNDTEMLTFAIAQLSTDHEFNYGLIAELTKRVAKIEGFFDYWKEKKD